MDRKEQLSNVVRRPKSKMDYRKIKDKHRVTGTGRKKWKFLEPLDQVLGDKSTTVPPVVVDTSHESLR